MKGQMYYYGLKERAKEILNDEEFRLYEKISESFITKNQYREEIDYYVEVYKSRPKISKGFKIKIINRFLCGSGRGASWVVI